jgi:hypothetical protein
MNGGVPEMLVVAGTALMALAIFGPFRKPIEPAESERPAEPPIGREPWPALVAATALSCDAPARIDLAEALGSLRSAWAETILQAAYETETDPAVRSAIASALSSSQSLVT